MKNLLLALCLVALPCAKLFAADPAGASPNQAWEYGFLGERGLETTWTAGTIEISDENISTFISKLVDQSVITKPAGDSKATMAVIWNALGERGWELVAVAPYTGGRDSVATYYFKRPKK
jgi:hypothetical protein